MDAQPGSWESQGTGKGLEGTSAILSAAEEQGKSWGSLL